MNTQYIQLQKAVVKNDLLQVKELVAQGANIHADNEFAVRWSARNGHLELVKYLTSQGADINMAIKDGECSKTLNLLKTYIKKQLYKGPINDKTETDAFGV